MQDAGRDDLIRARPFHGLSPTPDYEPDQAQLEQYWASLELLEARDIATPLVRQLRFELETLALLPPDPG